MIPENMLLWKVPEKREKHEKYEIKYENLREIWLSYEGHQVMLTADAIASSIECIFENRKTWKLYIFSN